MEYQAKLNEKYTPVSILFQVLKVLLIKRHSQQFFYFYHLLHQQISFLHLLALQSTLSEKRFSTQIFTFFGRFTPTLQPPKSAKHEENLFFYLLFGCPRPTFGHCGASLIHFWALWSITNPMLIAVFSLFCLEGHQKPLEQN